MVRFAQPSRIDNSDNMTGTGTSANHGVLTPAQALAPPRLALISTDPVGWVKRRRIPVEVPRKVVSTTWWANPYSRSERPNPTDNSLASSANTAAPVSGIGSPQSAGSPEPVSSGALSPASGAVCAAYSDAATRSASAAGSTTLELCTPTRAI